MDKTIRELTEVLQMDKRETKPYDTTAEVVRVEDNIAWCHIPGGIDETPVNMTIDAKEGDIVQVRVSGGRAWITGNESSPPTDDTIAKVANRKATDANKKADSAQVTAENAEQLASKANAAAQSVNQYFWHTETDTGAGAGAHITEVTQEEFLDDPDNGGGNLLAQSGGIFIRDGLTEIASFSNANGEGLLTLQDRNACLLGGYYDTNAGSAMTRYQVIVPNSNPRIWSTFGMTARGTGSFVEMTAEDNNGSNYIQLTSAKMETSGDITATGDIYTEGHGTPIGYNNTGSGTKNSFPNNSQTELVGGISVTPGTWLLIARVGFPSNATGRRFACWHNNTTAADYYTSYSTTPAASGGYTNVQTVMAIKVTENTVFAVQAYQNSGSSMNISYNWAITRIA